MNTEIGYNGWKNYPTWAVSMWIGNDEGLYNYAREITVTDAGIAAGSVLYRMSHGKDLQRDVQCEINEQRGTA